MFSRIPRKGNDSFSLSAIAQGVLQNGRGPGLAAVQLLPLHRSPTGGEQCVWHPPMSSPPSLVLLFFFPLHALEAVSVRTCAAVK